MLTGNNLHCHIVATPETADISFDRLVSEAMILSIEADMPVTFVYVNKKYNVDFNEWFSHILESAK